MGKRFAFAAFVIIITATTARAGITDPAPVGFVHVWTIPGVINNLSVGTAFVCTATDTNTVSVEVFDAKTTRAATRAAATFGEASSCDRAAEDRRLIHQIARW